MINLLFVIHDHSGARTYANELLSYFKSIKQINIYLLYYQSRYYKEYIILEKNGITEIHIPSAFDTKINIDKFVARCLDLIQPIFKDKDNLILHLNYCTQSKFAVKARERFGAHLVYTVHFLPEFMTYYSINNKITDEPEFTGDALEKFMIQEADHIICVTHFAKEAINRWYNVPKEKVTAIHNGRGALPPEELNFEKNKELIKKEFGFEEKERILLFVGLLEKRKGLKFLINVFKELAKKYTDIRLVIAGEGNFSDILEYAKGCWGKITLTGKISFNEVCQLYSIADIGVIPSVFEQCSYVALEMMEYGLPMVVAAAPGLKELYDNEKNALLVPVYQSIAAESVELEIKEGELQQVFERLLNNQTLKDSLARNLRLKWENKHTASCMGEATIKIYKQLTGLQWKNEFVDIEE